MHPGEQRLFFRATEKSMRAEPSPGFGVRVVVFDVPSKQGRFDGVDGVYTRNIVYREVLSA